MLPLKSLLPDAAVASTSKCGDVVFIPIFGASLETPSPIVSSLTLMNLRWGLLSVLGDCCPFSGDSCAFTPYGKVHFA